MEPSIRLLTLVVRLRDETHPGATRAVGLDSHLERDCGFDSLTRAELLMRVEREFGCSLPAELLGTAETPRHLLAALLAGRGATADVAAAPAPVAADDAATVAVPLQATTLLDVLDWHAERHGGRTHIVFVDGDVERPLAFGELRRQALAVAAGLQARGFAPGEAAALMLPTCAEFFPCFLGILLAGGIPVPIYPPARPSQIEDHLRRHAAILENAGTSVLLTFAEALLPARLLRGQVDCLRDVALATELAAGDGVAERVAAKPESIAFLQYTSGSTGTPKGVMLTHANLLANIRAMGTAAQVGPQDVFVSWLPLYHDMGLICAWLSSLYHGMRFVVMSPLAFLAQPARWLWAIHRHRGTLSGAPNFAYELCLGRIDAVAAAGLDLSSWRVAFNGAEPVNADTMQRFVQRYAAHGLQARAITPAYGLAECAVGLAASPGQGLRVDRVRRSAFVATGEVLPAAADETDALVFVACGRPLPAHELRIVDGDGRELPERREGRLQFRGPSATAGYYRNPAASAALLAADGWLESGDRAYVADGEVFPTGRSKDIVIKGGRNLYPQELEAAVGALPGIRQGNVAVFGVADAVGGTERLVVAAQSRSREAAEQARLCEAIRGLALDVLGVPADEVVVSHRPVVLKTSSGKIRRAASRDLYLAGGVAAQRAVWLQVLRLALAGALPALRRRLGAGLERIWALWAWTVFAVAAPVAWCAVQLLPTRALRWRALGWTARAVLGSCGVPLRVAGLEHLRAAGPCVLVANHASYLDGLVLAAALPWRDWRFVAKRELAANMPVRRFLDAVGCEFVERFDFRQGVADAARIAGCLCDGASPVFFAEGTFSRVPGLRPFRMGAFVAAAQNGVPVLPLALHGTRNLLRDGSWWPRRQAVTATVGAPLLPAGDDWAAAADLRRRARTAILAACGEADLDAD